MSSGNGFLLNTTHRPNVGPTLARRQRRRPNIGSTLRRCVVFAGLQSISAWERAFPVCLPTKMK